MWRFLEKVYKRIEEKDEVSLVTLVEARGSTYRRPGSKMVVSTGEYMEGAISGGCLESDVAHHARAAMEANENKVIHYELDDDVVFGLGIGCGGNISLLIETGVKSWLTPLLSNREPAVVVKLIEAENPSLQLGTLGVYRSGKLIWQADQSPISLEVLGAHCEDALSRRNSAIVELLVNGQKIRMFLDVVLPPHHLIIFGAGDDAIPVAMFANQLGFEVTVTDHRPINLETIRFPNCKRVKWEGPDTTLQLNITEQTAVMVMAHHLKRDAEALETFLKTTAYYVGLLGPQKRLQKFEEHLTKLSVEELAAQDRLSNPVGLDIGSETPEEVAISILSEIIAIRNGQAGGRLRDKRGAIHRTIDTKQMAIKLD